MLLVQRRGVVFDGRKGFVRRPTRMLDEDAKLSTTTRRADDSKSHGRKEPHPSPRKHLQTT